MYVTGKHFSSLTTTLDHMIASKGVVVEKSISDVITLTTGLIGTSLN